MKKSYLVLSILAILSSLSSNLRASEKLKSFYPPEHFYNPYKSKEVPHVKVTVPQRLSVPYFAGDLDREYAERGGPGCPAVVFNIPSDRRARTFYIQEPGIYHIPKGMSLQAESSESIVINDDYTTKLGENYTLNNDTAITMKHAYYIKIFMGDKRDKKFPKVYVIPWTLDLSLFEKMHQEQGVSLLQKLVRATSGWRCVPDNISLLSTEKSEMLFTHVNAESTYFPYLNTVGNYPPKKLN
ncbi:MAG: hypothetical protein ACPGXY_05475 [Alphaproteobacteria bacterium]